MSYRLVSDENVEHEVLHRLVNYGHDVEHVDDIPPLGKGVDDRPIGDYSLETERLIVTYDSDFVLKLDEAECNAAPYVADATLSAAAVADIIHGVSRQYPQEELDGLEYIGAEWLD